MEAKGREKMRTLDVKIGDELLIGGVPVKILAPHDPRKMAVRFLIGEPAPVEHVTRVGCGTVQFSIDRANAHAANRIANIPSDKIDRSVMAAGAEFGDESETVRILEGRK